MISRAAVEDEDVKDLRPPLFNQEIKNDQWMGVTVRSQGVGGKVSVNYNDRLLNEINELFTMFIRWQVLVCAHRYIVQMGDSQHGQGLCYVLNNDLKYDEAYEPCRGRSTARAHEEYGFCQAGTSGILLDDDSMILGSPGPITWRGTIFVISVGGDYLKRDKHTYYGPHTEQTSPVDKYSYLGKRKLVSGVYRSFVN